MEEEENVVESGLEFYLLREENYLWERELRKKVAFILKRGGEIIGVYPHRRNL